MESTSKAPQKTASQDFCMECIIVWKWKLDTRGSRRKRIMVLTQNDEDSLNPMTKKKFVDASVEFGGVRILGKGNM